VRELSFARDISVVMSIVKRAVRSLTDADGATFVLRDGSESVYADEDAIAPLWKGQRFPMSTCISGWVMLNRTPAAIEDVYADPRIPVDAYRPTFVKSLVMTPVRATDPIAAIGAYWAQRHRASDDEVATLQALADATALALTNVALYRDLECALAKEREARAIAETAESRARFLADVPGLLAGSLVDYEQTLQRIAEVAVPAIADVCVLDVVDAPGRWRRAAVAHVGPSQHPLSGAVDGDLAGAPSPLDGSGPVLVQDVADPSLAGAAASAAHGALARRLHARSLIVVPLVANERVLGLLTLAVTESRRRYDAADLAIAETVARRAAIAIEHAQLYRQAETARVEAESANRAKDEFLATLSHELRTPLTSILGWAHILRMGRADTSVVAKASDTITRNAQAQIQLIDDLLDMSRVVSGKMQLHVQPVDLARVIRNALDAIAPATAAKGIEVRTDLGTPATVVLGDPDRLQQVVWNLVNNAAKFTPRGGRIEIELATRGEHAEIVVRDTGQGITPDVLSHIFDRFRQADSSASRPHGGLGIGLALVRHLVELHGGTVSAASRGAYLGSTFTVRLPLSAAGRDEAPPAAAQPEAPAPVPVASTRRALEGLRILVLDDDRDSREVIGAMLSGAGASVRACASAREGVAALTTWQPHVVLSDIEMPGEDGYEFLSRVRALGTSDGATPVAALTAYARPHDRNRALAAGFDTYLSKPVVPAELVATVARLARTE
jgi:signal transduction histidine kinase/ActR/RegA family two-component response regulator